MSKKKKEITQLPPHPNTVFDEKKFLEMLNESVSLTNKEKQRIVKSIPQLTQDQIEKLIGVFKAEKQKFAEQGLTLEQVREQREKPISLRQIFQPALEHLRFFKPSNLKQTFKVLIFLLGFPVKKNSEIKQKDDPVDKLRNG